MSTTLGPTWMRRKLRRRISAKQVERAWYRRYLRRLRAWVDLLLGSGVPAEDKEAVLRDSMVAVLTGQDCAKVYESEKEFDRDFRALLQKRCAALLEGPEA